jgi:hypothetical protein
MERGRKSKVEAAGIEPAGSSSQPIAMQQVTESSNPQVSTSVAPAGRCMTLNDADWQDLVSIIAAWPRLTPNVREAAANLVRRSL